MGPFQTPGFIFTAEAMVRINATCETDPCVLIQGDVKPSKMPS